MATLRAAGRASQELIWAPSLTFWGWSWCGEQEAGDIGTWEPQARVFGNRGLRSSLPIWLNSDLVVQGEEHATHGLARWCQASTQRARRLSPPSQNLTAPEEALCPSTVQVAQCFKYSRVMGH